MRITDILDPRSISLTATPKTKSEALDQLVDLMCASGKINDKEAYRKQVYDLELVFLTENVMQLTSRDLQQW